MKTCWQGHEQCATYDGGPCLEIECTCETSGVCMSCPPSSSGQWKGNDLIARADV